MVYGSSLAGISVGMNTRARSSHAQRRGAPARPVSDDELDALIEREPFAALCRLVEQAGGAYCPASGARRRCRRNGWSRVPLRMRPGNLDTDRGPRWRRWYHQLADQLATRPDQRQRRAHEHRLGRGHDTAHANCAQSDRVRAGAHVADGARRDLRDVARGSPFDPGAGRRARARSERARESLCGAGHRAAGRGAARWR